MKPGNIMKTLVAAQAAMAKAQKEIEVSEFEGSSGGGLVKIKINGKGEALDLIIDPAVLTEDAETVSDLVKAAFTSAANQREALSKQKLKDATGKLLPIGFNIPGLG